MPAGGGGWGTDPIHNGRVKLTATALNNCAIATIVAGLIVPVVGYAYGLANVPVSPLWWLTGLAWLVSGISLHIGGRMILGRRRP